MAVVIQAAIRKENPFKRTERDEALLALELADLRTSDYDLALTGLDTREIDDLLLSDVAEEDAAPPLPAQTVTQPGDLWLCGPHRVLCGDATDPFFRYAALEAPAQGELIQRVLAIPNQRQPRTMVGFLTRPEIEALLAAPDRTRWLGRRDYAFLITAVQTGLRLSEMTALRHEDISFGTGAHVRCRGKGRKERCTPLAKPTVAVLQGWIREQGRGDSKTLFPSSRGGPLSADGVQHLLARHVMKARKSCASLRNKRVSPHVLRHAAAMELLQAGVDRAVIALWLGHESVETTQIYLDADLALKEQALARTNPVKGAPKRYQPDDELLAFLRQL